MLIAKINTVLYTFNLLRGVDFMLIFNTLLVSKEGRWKQEVMDMFIAVILVMVSWVYAYPNPVKLYTLNMYRFTYVNQTSMSSLKNKINL